MNFIGRSQELTTLEREYQRQHPFVVLYGRRRVGKTRLIKQFIAHKHALYFLASRESDALNRVRFAQAVAAFTGQDYLAHASFTDWRPLFQALADHARTHRTILVIDELPYLVTSNPAFPSVLQYAWDEVLSQSNVMLILCGSSIHMMRDKVLAHDSPLYGRRTAQLRLKPLTFWELASTYPHIPFKRMVDLYAITGGVPKYLEFFDPIAPTDSAESIPFEQALRENAFTPTGFLYEEPIFLLEQESRNPSNALSILGLVARGNHRPGDIARAMGVAVTKLPAQLKTLVELGYLERTVPFSDKDPAKSKNSLYDVADEFLAFWFAYAQPYASNLEMGNIEPSLSAMRRTFESHDTPFLFEKLMRQAFLRACAERRINFTPVRIGSYWTRTRSIELDVCAYDRATSRTLLGECKYHDQQPFSVQEYQRVLEKAPHVPQRSNEPPLIALFSATGFDPALHVLAQAGKVLLFNEGELLKP